MYTLLLLISFSIFAIIDASNVSNSSNSSNLCTSNRTDFSSPQIVECPCADIEKYNCCTSMIDAIFCPYNLTSGQIIVYRFWNIGNLLLVIVLLGFAIYAIRQDYDDQRQKHNGKKPFAFKWMLRSRINVITVVFSIITIIWLFDPHDGLPLFGVELYSNLVRNLLLRTPLWLEFSGLLLMILLWKDIVESARKLRKKSKQAKEAEDKRRLLIASGFGFLFFLFGTTVNLLHDFIPKAVSDNLTNALIAFITIFLGFYYAPYTAYQINKLLKTMKSKSTKRVVKSVNTTAKTFTAVSGIGLFSFIYYLMIDTGFSGKMIFYFGVHFAFETMPFIMVYGALPSNSNKSKSMRGFNTEGATSTAVQPTTVEP